MIKFNLYHRLAFLITLLFISEASKAADYKDVAPIFIANCTSCHHAGGIGFPMTQYSQIFPLGATIRHAILENHMPPWPADPTYKHYVKERVLSPADKAALVDWIDNGMLAGDTTLAPPVPVYGATQLNGTPDLILELPKFVSTAVNGDHYYCMNIPTGLLQDRYIRAFEFVPGNAPIIHHAVITIDTTGNAVDDFSGNCFNQQGQLGIGDYAPGMGPTVLPGVAPAKFGFRLKAGSKLSIQIHVPQGTAGLQDSSTLRLYFYPVNEPNVREMLFNTVLQNWNFFIPANDSVTVTQKYPAGAAGLPIAFSLYGSFPHSHKTCTAITNYAYNNGDTIPLIRINRWDFHWQGQYTFKNLVKVPANYHLMAVHKFDNTINNPETPNPNMPVVPGTNTYDEMLFDSFLFTYYLPGDELINIDSILQNDPLFYPTGIAPIEKVINTVKVYPNPFDEMVHLEYNLNTSQFVTVNIYNQSGQVVRNISGKIERSGNHAHEWDGTDNNGNKLPAGVYIYKIQAGLKVMSGKVFLK